MAQQQPNIGSTSLVCWDGFIDDIPNCGQTLCQHGIRLSTNQLLLITHIIFVLVSHVFVLLQYEKYSACFIMTCNVLQVCITMNTPDFECFSQKKIKITKLDFTTRTHQLKTNAYAIQPPMSKILYLNRCHNPCNIRSTCGQH